MQQDMVDPNTHRNQILELCKRYHYHFVQIESTDGNVYEGIIDGTEDDHINLLVPSGDIENDDNRLYLYGGYRYGGGYPYGYGYPRRFRRSGGIGRLYM